jgi:hypothetical protein
MSLDHDFLLLDHDTSLDDASLMSFLRDPRALHVHDILFGYMQDSLAFIPAFNPSLREQHHGLNRWGLTVIRKEGAEVATRVFQGWADLFEEPGAEAASEPEGAPVPVPEAPPDPARIYVHHDYRGNHLRFDFDREAAVGLFRQLADFCARITADNRLFLLHIGI